MAELHSFEPVLTAVAARVRPLAILEWGPGLSTRLLANLAPNSRILSIEHDKRYFDLQRAQLDRPNVELTHVPHLLPFGGSAGYVTYPLRWLAERGLPRRHFDLIFVDGRSRCDCAVVASLVLREGGAVVVHDSERANYQPAFRMFGRIEDHAGTIVLSEPRSEAAERPVTIPTQNAGKRAVVTVHIGPKHAGLAARTHPLMRRYADRHGAEFVVIDTPKLNDPADPADPAPWYGWEKYQLFNLLERYAEVLFLDSDVLVRPDCPELWAFCGDRFGAFNEVPHNPRALPRLERYCQLVGLPTARTRPAYYNGGVFVCTAAHRAVFARPPMLLLRQEQFRYAEQSHLNARLHQARIACRDLPRCFNAMPGWLKVPGFERECPVVHLAECGPEREAIADRLLAVWRSGGFDV